MALPWCCGEVEELRRWRAITAIVDYSGSRLAPISRTGKLESRTADSTFHIVKAMQGSRRAAEQVLRLQAGACWGTIGDWLHPPDRQGASCKVRGILGPVEGPGVASHRRAPVDGAPRCDWRSPKQRSLSPCPAMLSSGPSPPWRIAGASAAIAQMAADHSFSAPFLADFPDQIRLDHVAIPCSRNPTLWPLFMCN